jgi:hypothetical protein
MDIDGRLFLHTNSKNTSVWKKKHKITNSLKYPILINAQSLR